MKKIRPHQTHPMGPPLSRGLRGRFSGTAILELASPRRAFGASNLVARSPYVNTRQSVLASEAWRVLAFWQAFYVDLPRSLRLGTTRGESRTRPLLAYSCARVPSAFPIDQRMVPNPRKPFCRRYLRDSTASLGWLPKAARMPRLRRGHWGGVIPSNASATRLYHSSRTH